MLKVLGEKNISSLGLFSDQHQSTKRFLSPNVLFRCLVHQATKLRLLCDEKVLLLQTYFLVVVGHGPHNCLKHSHLDHQIFSILFQMSSKCHFSILEFNFYKTHLTYIILFILQDFLFQGFVEDELPLKSSEDDHYVQEFSK